MLTLQIIYQDDYSGMCTYHAEFQIDRGMNYDAAVRVLEQEVSFFTLDSLHYFAAALALSPTKQRCKGCCFVPVSNAQLSVYPSEKQIKIWLAVIAAHLPR